MADSQDSQAGKAQPSVGTTTDKPLSQSAPVPAPTAAEAEDSDPDFDDLDDVLDQFSASANTKPPPVSSSSREHDATTTSLKSPSGPSKPETSSDKPKVTDQSQSEPALPEPQRKDETEDEFIARLSSEMSTLLSSMSEQHPTDSTTAQQSPEDLVKMGKELEDFTYKMEKEGIKPEDLLRAILGEEEGTKVADMAHQERDRRESEPGKFQSPSHSKSKPESSSNASSSAQGGAAPASASFEDTIRRTMSRLNQSDTQATNATQQSSGEKSEEDLLAEMLRAMDTQAGGDGGDDAGLSKMFLDMMHQLTHKSMLYEPMKELHTQFPAWLEQNKPPKTKKDEYERFRRQSVIVKDLVQKFEEPGYSDEDEKCREYIWEKMQAMQNEGAPPEELVKNPFPGTDFGSIPGLGGGGGGGGAGVDAEGLEEGCPTQ